MSDFFEKKNIKIKAHGEYDLSLDDDVLACGMDREDFLERNNLMYDQGEGFTVGGDDNPVGAIAKRLEDYFSKRELAFIVARGMIDEYLGGLDPEELKNLEKEQYGE